MRFVVPQFIDVEDKIIGPLSVRQFVIFLVGFGIIFILFKTLGFIAFLFMGLIVFGLTGIIAFAKVNGQPFHFFLVNIIYAFKRPKLKIWIKEAIYFKTGLHRKEKLKTAKVVLPKKMVTSSKLAQLSLVVDTGGAYHEQEEEKVKLT
ncbi:MAG: hypothetical protein COY66_02765 [Candidatus Kerfeldbacteria bacterium CG_4_10_14_0_8_um_filter_42_10]|uniref:PrgI family protein n=1 Tax=Candidatus Kerfeldbacteria bacterium CG_4_10_14_0_8_um_filter_42_10 TaxID=2014248 RepID=A0A2M7RJ92_9BACT|nr:MAG: hypothetical protein COY66_02765 [Candidatus Kerfeldbacteria bacterium CG_4_10_14_0_8_um_filter_42_10]